MKKAIYISYYKNIMIPQISSLSKKNFSERLDISFDISNVNNKIYILKKKK